MARPELKQADMERFREAAAAAALEVVEQEGVANLTLRRLAKRLGCSYAKPYTYYRDKDHLVDAVRGLGFDRLAQYAIEASAAGPITGDTYLRFALENPEIYRVMFALHQDYVSPETRAAQARAWEACAQPIRDAVAAGELQGDPELIAHVSWAALHGLVSLEFAGQLHLGKTFEEIAKSILDPISAFRNRAS